MRLQHKSVSNSAVMRKAHVAVALYSCPDRLGRLLRQQMSGEVGMHEQLRTSMQTNADGQFRTACVH